jgi:hypothetical protein
MKYVIIALLSITAFSQQFKNEAATKATKRYHLSILKARQRYSKDMKKAKLSAMQKGQLEEAIKIDKAIKQITGRPDDGVYTMILRDQETFKRQHYKVLFTPNKITAYGATLDFVPDPRGFILYNRDKDQVILWTLKHDMRSWYCKVWSPIEAYKKGLPHKMVGMAVKI